MTHRATRNCIVPIHMMERLASHSDAVGACARRSLLTSTRLSERRSLLRSIGTAGTAPGTKRRTVYDAQTGLSLPGKLVRGETDAPTGDRAADRVFDYFGATYDLFRDVYQRNSLDGDGHRLEGTVHYGTDFMNAYWDGRQMVFGDGDGEIFLSFTESIDIVGHELTHGVVQFTNGLEYHRQSGALNESFSDVFGSLVKQYTLKQTAAQADWLIGAGLLGPSVRGKALRSLKDPGTAYDDPRLGRDPQPAHMNDYVTLPDNELGDWGGVHINSGIPNKAFYELARTIGGNAWEVAGRIWYGTLIQLWSTAEFQHCAQVSTEVASTLYGAAERQAVADAWARVGVRVTPAELPKPVPPAGPIQLHELQAACAALKTQLQRIEEDIRDAIAVLP